MKNFKNMNDSITKSAQKYLDRVMEMHNSGLSSEEIACRIITLDTETVEFCLEAMVEIIIKFVSQCPRVNNNAKL